jgi:hypothetical protein
MENGASHDTQAIRPGAWRTNGLPSGGGGSRRGEKEKSGEQATGGPPGNGAHIPIIDRQERNLSGEGRLVGPL